MHPYYGDVYIYIIIYDVICVFMPEQGILFQHNCIIRVMRKICVHVYKLLICMYVLVLHGHPRFHSAWNSKVQWVRIITSACNFVLYKTRTMLNGEVFARL